MTHLFQIGDFWRTKGVVMSSPVPLFPGLFCCICFDAITADNCAIDASGLKWDTCCGQCAKEAGIEEMEYGESAGLVRQEASGTEQEIQGP